MILLSEPSFAFMVYVLIFTSMTHFHRMNPNKQKIQNFKTVSRSFYLLSHIVHRFKKCNNTYKFEELTTFIFIFYTYSYSMLILLIFYTSTSQTLFFKLFFAITTTHECFYFYNYIPVKFRLTDYMICAYR